MKRTKGAKHLGHGMWLQFLRVNQAWVVTMYGSVLKGPCTREECERWGRETKAEVDAAHKLYTSHEHDGDEHDDGGRRGDGCGRL